MSEKTDMVTEIKDAPEPPASRDTGPTGFNGQGSAGAQIVKPVNADRDHLRKR